MAFVDSKTRIELSPNRVTVALQSAGVQQSTRDPLA